MVDDEMKSYLVVVRNEIKRSGIHKGTYNQGLGASKDDSIKRFDSEAE